VFFFPIHLFVAPTHENLSDNNDVHRNKRARDNNLADNILSSGPITVRIARDVNMDGKVDIRDVAMVGAAFSSYPDHPRWKPVVDQNGDGKIDIFDVALTARNFGKTYP
jgi:uncharacterized protein (DUF2141 family)